MKLHSKKRTGEDWAIDIFVYGFLILFSVLTLFPFINMLALSLNEAWDTYKGGITIFPRRFTLANYQAIFSTSAIIKAYGISIYRTVAGTALSLVFCAATGYALSKKYLKIRKPFLAFLVFTTMFSGGIIPYYILLRNLNLLNNLLVYVIPGIYNVFNVLIFRTYFEGIPESIEESAKLDGANELKILWNIMIPLSKPVFAALALFTGVGLWNDWFTGEFYITSPTKWTVQNYLLKVLQGNAASSSIDAYINAGNGQQATKISPESVRMAVLMVTSIPIMCIYPFLQKYFVKGVMIGAVKG